MRSFARLAYILLVVGMAGIAIGCVSSPGVSGHFERTLSVNGPVILELKNGSGDAKITPGAGNQVHIRGDFTVRTWPWENSERRAQEMSDHPPIEQTGSLINVGVNPFGMGNVTVNYTIEVPAETELRGTVGSGEIQVRGIHGPARLSAGSGTINAKQIEQDTTAKAGSGTVVLSDIGGQVQATVGSGDVNVSGVQGELRVRAGSGDITIDRSNGAIDSTTGSGDVKIRDAKADVRAKSGSGDISIEGNPAPSSSWEFHTASGDVTLRVPSSASFRFYAHSISGKIETNIPLVVEEQPRHELRGRVGDGQARVQVVTASGDIILE